jgi:hypothetical protein
MLASVLPPESSAGVLALSVVSMPRHEVFCLDNVNDNHALPAPVQLVPFEWSVFAAHVSASPCLAGGLQASLSVSPSWRGPGRQKEEKPRKSFGWAMFPYSEQHISALLLYGSFGLATMASDMDISGNYEVEHLYSLSSLSYGHNSRQLLFSVSTIITMTLDDTRKNIALQYRRPSPNYLCSPLHLYVRKYKA